MKLRREATARIRRWMDDLLPPVVRDSRWLVAIPSRVLFGRRANVFLDFKDRATTMTADELAETYRAIQDIELQRETDLNDASLARVLESLAPGSVLEIGCGSGHLAERMAEAHEVTACDLTPPPRPLRGGVRFVQANFESLPVEDSSYDNVVSTHTLEHVQDLAAAVREVRRTARRRLVIVVPKQRPYRHTFDLHLHFFPYAHSVLLALRPQGAYTLDEVGGDWVYVEDLESRRRS